MEQPGKQIVPHVRCGTNSEKSRTAQVQDGGIAGLVVPLVADWARLHPSVLTADGRGPKPVAHARQLAMALFCDLHGGTHAVRDCAEAFQRDKSTILHALRAVSERRAADGELEAAYIRLHGQAGRGEFR